MLLLLYLILYELTTSCSQDQNKPLLISPTENKMKTDWSISATSVLILISAAPFRTNGLEFSNFFKYRAGSVRQARLRAQNSGSSLRTLFPGSQNSLIQSRLPHPLSTIVLPDRRLASPVAGSESGASQIRNLISNHFTGSSFGNLRSMDQEEYEGESGHSLERQASISRQSFSWYFRRTLYNWWRACRRYYKQQSRVEATTSEPPLTSGTTSSAAPTDDDDDEDYQITPSTQSTTTPSTRTLPMQNTLTTSASTTVLIDDDDGDEDDQTNVSTQNTFMTTASTTVFINNTDDDDDDKNDGGPLTPPANPAQRTPAFTSTTFSPITATDNSNDPIVGLFLPDSPSQIWSQANMIQMLSWEDLFKNVIGTGKRI